MSEDVGNAQEGCMRRCVLVAALTIATPAPRSDHVLHEKRETTSKVWIKRDAVSPKMSLPMRIGLKQSNLDNGHNLLMDVSHPDSPNYGKYYTPDDVNEIFAPSHKTVEIVHEWLVASGIPRERVSQSANKAWLQFDADAEEAEELFKTKYYIYQHKDSGTKKVACDEYHLPSHVREHVDYITPGIRLLNSTNFTHCDTVMTINCIRALYQIPKPSKATPGNELGMYEYADVYNQIGLHRYWRDFAPEIPQDYGPQVRGIDGGIAPGPQGRGTESYLDLDLAHPLLYPQGVVIYQGLFNNSLDAIDGSYCAYAAYGETGNNPDYDYAYPDPAPGGYEGALQCGVYEPTNVISVSYDWAEVMYPASYQRRQCDEWMKLGLRGVSVVFSSADYGSWSSNGCLGNGAIFNPAYPAGCPYITVGADVTKDKEVAASSLAFRSGGGFSNIYAAPDYQKDAVDNYFDVADPIVQAYPYYTTANNESLGAKGGIYNRGGRGYPDVSAVGDNIVVYAFNQTVYPMGGTSASAPISGSILTLINEERLAAGKSTAGFVNPVLYAHPEVLHDITSGNNSGCGTAGFIASKGWDPVTGLGTPNYPKMLDLWMSLP
ncbi:hypothetical protein K449DRAFT_455218 [Hypoxylon sp. EC38]|nr:hypothetical protein K449DRAFT_455218 [Hypoxylon sp. EC38]